MSNSYFRQVPNFSYVNRNYDRNKFDDFLTVKNIFKRVKIRDDIFQNLTFFGKYSIVGNERPDNVAFNIYNDSSYDWLVLLSNNILNIHDEWPLSNESFDKVMIEKYGSYENLYAVHHYETIEVRDSANKLILPAGIIVPEKIVDKRPFVLNEDGINVENPNYLKQVSYYIEYYDSGRQEEALASQITIPITNYQIEEEKEDKKRNIFVLKPEYLGVILDDIEKLMKYKKGTPQYVSDALKKGDNIRLFS
jgi:hypothetical protein